MKQGGTSSLSHARPKHDVESRRGVARQGIPGMYNDGAAVIGAVIETTPIPARLALQSSVYIGIGMNSNHPAFQIFLSPCRLCHLRSSLKSSSPSLEAFRPSLSSIGPDLTQNSAAEEGSGGAPTRTIGSNRARRGRFGHQG